MKIGIDARLWSATGVGRYIRNLVTELAKIDSKNEYILFCQSKDREDVNSMIHDSDTSKKLVPLRERFMIQTTDIPWHSVEEQIRLPQILNKQKLDLMHFTYFSVPILYNKPFVMTLHDLIVNKHATGRASTLPLPLYAIKRLGYHAVLGSAIGRAKKIIVPSNAVAANLHEEYPALPKENIEVIYEGGFEKEFKIKNLKFKIDKPYLLRVGNYYPHKNVEGLLEAFRLVLEKRIAKSDQLKLILVGKKDYFYNRIQKLTLRLGVGEDIIFLDNVDDGELNHLYKNAIATVVPSLAEGFSLTCVEAMSLGSPVVASDIPVHREVCDDAAIYFDPTNPLNISERLGFALDLTESSRKELISQGKKQSSKFSWEKMATETLQVYNFLNT